MKIEDSSRYRQEFFSIATQYYIAGRFSLFSRLIPVCGNLFHHAIEMYLKGYFSHKFSSKKLRRKFSHNLQKIWAEFKNDIQDPGLEQCDDTIQRLHKFELIRYPDEYISKGMIAVVGIKSGDSTYTDESSSRPEPRYGFDLEEIDCLVRVIFEKSSVNPLFFTDSLNDDALSYLKRENEDEAWFTSP